MKEGLTHTSTTTVDNTNVASAVASGTLEVFSTPAMIALMEKAAYLAVENSISDEESTVGTDLNIKHLKASPIGEAISAKATLVKIEGRALTFEVEAHDSKGKIGEGMHTRYIVNIEKFLSKIQ